MRRRRMRRTRRRRKLADICLRSAKEDWRQMFESYTALFLEVHLLRSQAWWCTPLILILGKQRQEDVCETSPAWSM